jgi:hypothetical protein
MWWLVHLIAAHSLAVGLVLLLVPQWAVQLGGWGEADPTFFVRQGGAFHLVVAVGYILEYRRSQSVVLLLFAKALAFVFLIGVTVLEPGTAWAVPFSGVADGAMGLTVLAVRRSESRRSSH